MNLDKVLLDFSSTPFKNEDGMGKLAECKKTAEKYGFDFGVQLHNTAGDEEINKLADSGVKLSAHAPLAADYSINLAAESFELADKLIKENCEKFRQLGITRTVFHGFGMTDKPIPMFGRGVTYDECMMQVFRPELSLDSKTRICNDFTETKEFKERQLRVKERLEYISNEYPDILWCLENDFPAYGSANIFPESTIFLNHPACLDSSHLWATSFIYDRDFHEETLKYLNSGLVEMVHLHASIYDDSFAKADWSDGHLPLNTPNSMDLPRFIKACRDAGVKHYVLEIVKGSCEDIHAFAEMWNQ
jgi:sugar phosphate isomerase/epimerase